MLLFITFRPNFQSIQSLTEELQNRKLVRLKGKLVFQDKFIYRLCKALPFKKKIVSADRTVKFVAEYVTDTPDLGIDRPSIIRTLHSPSIINSSFYFFTKHNQTRHNSDPTLTQQIKFKLLLYTWHFSVFYETC